MINNGCESQQNSLKSTLIDANSTEFFGNLWQPTTIVYHILLTPKFFKKVTKADVIAEIADKTGIDKADVSSTLESFFTVVKDNLAGGEPIYVRGFGSFVNKKRAKKVARNISKNTSIVIDEHFIPSFKPAKIFIEQVKTNAK